MTEPSNPPPSSEPPSEATATPTTETGTPSVGRASLPVWYAAYGSNLLRARFLTYLQGGEIPNATDGRVQRGAQDTTAPSDDRPLELRHQLIFAHAARRWGQGGVAKLSLETSPAVTTHARAWRITAGQFDDVFAQENRQDEVAGIDVEQCLRDGRVDVWPTRYGTLLHVGTIDDEPVLTFTGATVSGDLRPAHLSYLRVMAAGLGEVRNWDLRTAAHYLAACPGNQGRLDPTDLAGQLED